MSAPSQDYSSFFPSWFFVCCGLPPLVSFVFFLCCWGFACGDFGFFPFFFGGVIGMGQLNGMWTIVKIFALR